MGRLCSSVVRAVDRQSNDLGSNPRAVRSVFFSQKDFKFFNFLKAVSDIKKKHSMDSELKNALKFRIALR